MNPYLFQEIPIFSQNNAVLSLEVTSLTLKATQLLISPSDLILHASYFLFQLLDLVIPQLNFCICSFEAFHCRRLPVALAYLISHYKPLKLF